jgi:transposase-like protein
LDVSAYVALGQQVEVGEHACPECGQRLGSWGGYWRWVRGPGTERLWIRRCRCARCRRSHALLPDFLFERRLDHVQVIGQALALSIASGLGMRPIAERLGVPMTTARDWRRRFRVNALLMVAALVALAVGLDPASVLLSGRDHERTALEALAAIWQRARMRFGQRVPELWRCWSLISGGRALGTNRSPPYAGRTAADWMTLIP